MNDFVLKTFCLVGSSSVKKGIMDIFSYVLEKDLENYTMIDNELAKANFKSIANKTDLHFVNSQKTHHINVEINQFKLETTEQKNRSYIFKIGGEFYTYLEKEDLYKF